MPTNPNNRRERTPVEERKGIKISAKTRQLYEQRNRALDDDPDAAPLAPDKWANAMRRDEYFRPVKKQLTVRIDADILAWLKAKGGQYQTHLNAVLCAAKWNTNSGRAKVPIIFHNSKHPFH